MGLSSIIQSNMSRRAMQPLWETFYKVCVRGMGYDNYDPSRNGEFRVLKEYLTQFSSETPVVIDVGANEGDFTAAALEFAPAATIHAFEPNPPTFGRLSHRFGQQHNVILNNVGLSDAPGELELADYVHAKGSGHATFFRIGLSTIQPEVRELTDGELVLHWVPVTALDTYIKEKGLGFVDYLKIDVEGFERQVLIGAKDLIHSHRVGAIQLEINAHNAVNGFSLYRLIQTLEGYRCMKILPDGLYSINYRSLHDIFRYANFLFVSDRKSSRGKSCDIDDTGCLYER